MNKQAALQEIYQSSFKDEIEKTGKFDAESIERILGGSFSNKQINELQKHVDDAKEKSFILRHPLLTGIPTLGIAPAVAKGLASEKIIRHSSRKDPAIRKLYNALIQHQRDVNIAAAGAPETNVSQNTYY